MVFETIQDMLCQCLGCDPSRVAPDTVLLEDLECTAEDLDDVLLGVEEEYGVAVPDGFLTPRVTVADLVRLVEEAL